MTSVGIVSRFPGGHELSVLSRYIFPLGSWRCFAFHTLWGSAWPKTKQEGAISGLQILCCLGRKDKTSLVYTVGVGPDPEGP